jgi:hypothetical protein
MPQAEVRNRGNLETLSGRVYIYVRPRFAKGDRMKMPCLIIAAALVVPVSAYAQAAKPCEELKSEIAKKMDGNGVKSYSLEIVEKEKEVQGKVVGSCEGGAKKIVYSRTTTTATNPQNPATPSSPLSPEASKH